MPGNHCCQASGDHPRIHGEHVTAKSNKTDTLGSPPHTRGTLDCFRLKDLKHRITPAYTGNTSFQILHNSSSWDHPRIHGEHRFTLLETFPLEGSPPHTRGTLTMTDTIVTALRITPAYTGNTKANKESLKELEDHPRIHGEHTKRSLIYRHF